jgi:hypothetical protein
MKEERALQRIVICYICIGVGQDSDRDRSLDPIQSIKLRFQEDCLVRSLKKSGDPRRRGHIVQNMLQDCRMFCQRKCVVKVIINLFSQRGWGQKKIFFLKFWIINMFIILLMRCRPLSRCFVRLPCKRTKCVRWILPSVVSSMDTRRESMALRYAPRAMIASRFLSQDPPYVLRAAISTLFKRTREWTICVCFCHEQMPSRTHIYMYTHTHTHTRTSV